MKFNTFVRLAEVLEMIDDSSVYNVETSLHVVQKLTDRKIALGVTCSHDKSIVSIYSDGQSIRKAAKDLERGLSLNGTDFSVRVISVQPPHRSKDDRPESLPFYLLLNLVPDNGVQVDELIAATKIVLERAMLCNRNSIRNCVLRARLTTKNLLSFADKTLAAVRKDMFPCHGATIFTYDKRIDQLRLSRTTGLASASGASDVVIKKSGSSWVAKSYNQRRTMFEWAETDVLAVGRTAEKLEGPPKSRAYLPFRPEIEMVINRREGNGSTDCSGLLRLVNCLDTRGQVRPFDEFDRFNLQYLGELIHVNITGFIEKEVDGFDKDLAFHAAASVADGIVKNVDMAQRLLFGESIERESGVYNIPRQFEIKKLGTFGEGQIQTLLNNAYAFATDIQSQIERSNVSPKNEEHQSDVVEKLLADVIMKAVNLRDSMRTAHSIDEKVIVNRIFDLERPPPVIGNQGELVSVFKNIIDNSIKYKRPNRNAEITFSLAVDSQFVTVEVSDKGIGVKEDELELLFRPTYRTEAAKSHRVRGSGLGLYYCKTIVESIGGEIWIERRDVGLSVFVRLKLAGK